jgi:hypothetical protein
VGWEGPIVQIGSALASSLGQWVRMPENRLRILVACGAGGGIAATFNAPVTGVFFGVEIIMGQTVHVPPQHPVHGPVAFCRVLLRQGPLAGVYPQQVVQPVPARRGGLHQMAIDEQLQCLFGVLNRHAEQRGGGRKADVRPVSQAEQTERAIWRSAGPAGGGRAHARIADHEACTHRQVPGP